MPGRLMSTRYFRIKSNQIKSNKVTLGEIMVILILIGSSIKKTPNNKSQQNVLYFSIVKFKEKNRFLFG